MKLILLIISLILLSTSSMIATAFCPCQPNQACWPNASEWSAFEKQLTGKLVKPTSLLTACRKDAKSLACAEELKNLHNPFFLQANPAGLQTQGWLDAWDNQTSEYAVEAQSSADVVAAVNFARKHKLRLVVKGAGHDYLGRSNAAGSLLIWTHKMRQTKFENAFIPVGCSKNTKPISAITIEAGARWVEVYRDVTVNHNRYVQGGGCTTVGAAGGFTQGGGFGSFSKKFGTGAAGVLQVEIVTANGQVVIANQCQNQDLFWAIRGGGGGTFGVVTKMTLKTHPLPSSFGLLQGTIVAKDDKAFQKLIRYFLTFYRDKLNNEHWGEQIAFTADNKINLYLVFQGLTRNDVKMLWQPLHGWIKKQSELFQININVIQLPSRGLWNYQYLEKNFPEFISLNPMKEAGTGEFWWASNSNEVSKYWYTYQSWWLPAFLFRDNKIQLLSDLFFKASRLTPVSLHINKGLGGASPEAIRAGRETSTNPSVYDANVLLIMTAGNNQVFPHIKGHEPDIKQAKIKIKNIHEAMQLFISVAPNAGTYVNEADYFQTN